MGFLTEAGQRELENAVETVEAGSAAEIMIALRPRARYAFTQHATVGLVAAIAILAFMLYSPLEFAPWQVLVLPILAGILGALLVEAIPPLYRFIAPPWQRYEHVREAAFTAFVERGVHATRDRTGILIYIALRERMVEIVADLEALDALGIKTLAAWAGTLEAQLPRGADAFAKALRDLAPELAKVLPRRAGDVDELGNAVQVIGAPAVEKRDVR